MNRKIFFWIEQLKINPAERKTITVLFVLFVSLYLLRLHVSPSNPYGDDNYEKVEEVFRERQAQIRAREAQLLARYGPQRTGYVLVDAVADTLESDSAGHKKPDVTQKININTAGAEMLRKLPGIGPAYAERIIEYRRKHGRFTEIDQLLEIKGIVKKRLDKLKPFVKLKDSKPEQEYESDVK